MPNTRADCPGKRGQESTPMRGKTLPDAAEGGNAGVAGIQSAQAHKSPECPASVDVHCDWRSRSREWMFGVICGFAAVWLWHLTSVFMDRPLQAGLVEEAPAPSSAWCHFGPSGEKVCRFRNICYDPHFGEFQFLLTDDSVISGLSRPESWMDIDMSTVVGHNAFKMEVSIMSSFNYSKRQVLHYHQRPTFIIHRFKPDNIMHVIHDDLIPLHFTIESLFNKTAVQENHFSLAFSDNFDKTPLDEWYGQYSGTPFIRLTNISETICFREAYVGLYRTTIWFNYGFKQPQGFFQNDNFNLQGIINFVDSSVTGALKSNFSCVSCEQLTKVVILVRSQTRRILNLEALKGTIKKAHFKTYPENGLEIIDLDLAEHDISVVISHVRQAKLLVGMHGAGMILSIFLPPSASIVELFPFGINPDHVSFLKGLFKQRQLYPLHYVSWRNDQRQNSVPSAHDDPLTGKISHLPQNVQKDIRGLSEVPAVWCCHNPAYLYYIFHDTFVNQDTFQAVYQAFVKTLGNETHQVTLSYHIYPSFPAAVTCQIRGPTLSIWWGESSNLRENMDIWFQITLLVGEEVIIKNVSEKASNKVFSLEIGSPAPLVQMWFQPFNIKNVGGHIKHKNCNEAV